MKYIPANIRFCIFYLLVILHYSFVRIISLLTQPLIPHILFFAKTFGLIIVQFAWSTYAISTILAFFVSYWSFNLNSMDFFEEWTLCVKALSSSGLSTEACYTTLDYYFGENWHSGGENIGTLDRVLITINGYIIELSGLLSAVVCLFYSVWAFKTHASLHSISRFFNYYFVVATMAYYCLLESLPTVEQLKPIVLFGNWPSFTEIGVIPFGFVFVVFLTLGALFHMYVLRGNRLFGADLEGASILMLCASILVFCVYLFKATNFVTLYCALEGLSLATMFLLSRNVWNSGSKEVFFKYFCLSSFSAILLLSALSVLYSLTFSLDFITIKLIIFKNALVLYNFLLPGHFLSFSFIVLLKLGLVLFFLSFIFKLGVFPLHFITPDLYTLTTPSFLFLYSAIVKPIYFFTLLYFYLFFVNSAQDLIVDLFLVSGLGSIVLGSSLALVQARLLKLLALGSIVQIGFLFLSLAFFSHVALPVIFLFFLSYWLTYIVALVGVQGTLAPMVFTNYNKVATLGGLGRRFLEVFGFVCLCIALLSNASIPPLIGFFSKYLLILSFLLKENTTFLVFLLIFNIYISYYYLRILYGLLYRLIYVKYLNGGQGPFNTDFRAWTFEGLGEASTLGRTCCVLFLLLYVTLPLEIDYIFCIVEQLTYQLI